MIYGTMDYLVHITSRPYPNTQRLGAVIRLMGRVTKGAGHVMNIRGYTRMVTLDRFKAYGLFTFAQMEVMVLHDNGLKFAQDRLLLLERPGTGSSDNFNMKAYRKSWADS